MGNGVRSRHEVEGIWIDKSPQTQFLFARMQRLLTRRDAFGQTSVENPSRWARGEFNTTKRIKRLS
ncbi:hypothetical protein CGRA01v4_03338 [Colletotrichum graminicola]|nr:hypothetical protein CGRA01v4_03338 [Colletotrichum graminicola]